MIVLGDISLATQFNCHNRNKKFQSPKNPFFFLLSLEDEVSYRLDFLCFFGPSLRYQWITIFLSYYLLSLSYINHQISSLPLHFFICLFSHFSFFYYLFQLCLLVLSNSTQEKCTITTIPILVCIATPTAT